MTDFRGNIEHWIRQAEPDYYLFFLKAWIPFNAWYVLELPHLNKRDSDIIRELQDNPKSKPKLIIENYLVQLNYESRTFKSHLAELHFALESKVIMHREQRVSFKSLNLSENPEKVKTSVDTFGNVYKAERTPSYFQGYIQTKGGKVLLDFKQPIYEISDLKKDVDFIRINDKDIQQEIIKCYEAINPKKPINLVCENTADSHFLLESKNSIAFIYDKCSISKGCIKVLYELRNMLFHGEIEPTNANKPIYEHAYNILRLILKELH